MRRLYSWTARLAAVALASAATTAGAADAPHQDDRDICGWAVAKVERAFRIPEKLMAAMTMAETGRWDKRLRGHYAWPWTVRSQNRGRYLANKDAAIAEVRKLQRQGVKNIDVGCMQVNLQHHPKAFESLTQAFDPLQNAEYAAHFLTSLHRDTRSWSRAVARYHSGLEARGRRYWRRVSTLWGVQRQRAYLQKQDRMRAIFRREKAARAARLGLSGTMTSIGAPIILRP